MPVPSDSSRPALKYVGTGDEVLLGDRVSFPTLFLRRRRLGRVVHIPSETAFQLAERGEEPQFWHIELDGGTTYEIIYAPEEVQPPKRLRLVERASGSFEGRSAAELEALFEIRGGESTWFDMLKVSAILAALVLAVAWVMF